MRISRHAILAVLLLAIGGALAWTSVRRASVTIDEFGIPQGLAIVNTGRQDIDPGVPPLPKLAWGLALRAAGATLPFDPPPGPDGAWACGEVFSIHHAAGYHDFFTLPRLLSVALLLVTIALAGAYARWLYGPTAGLLAMACASLDPNLLAHGALATTDIYFTCAGLAGIFAFHRYLDRPTAARGALWGVALGLATLCKFTGVLLWAGAALLLAALRWRRCWREPGAWAALGTGLLVMNAGYGFRDTLVALGDLDLASAPLLALQGLLPGGLPVPLPRWFVQGFDTQLAETGYQAYLCGRFNEEGFPAYYVVALLVKTPLALLGLGALAWLGGRPGRREWPLPLLAAFLFVVVSLTGHKNIGVRYLLLLYPLLHVWIGRLAATLPALAVARAQAMRIAAGVLLAGLVGTQAFSWPDYLPYFNAACGGSRNGHRYLLDSNVDWGQGLLALRDYMAREAIPRVDLAYAGRVRPEIYGIACDNLYAGPTNRFAVISANLLWGRTYYVNGTGFWPLDRDALARYRTQAPTAVLGHCLYVYDQNAAR